MFEAPVPIRDPRRRQRVVMIVAVVLLLSAALRLYQVANPSEFMFDEVYYAKDAKAIVDGRVGPKDGPFPWEAGDEVSWPHPEMGKFAIAAGILLFGDRAFGWRIPAVIAGMVMLALVYPLARRLGLPPDWALIALVFAAADPLGIAQSRIATLDVFVSVWSVLCIYLGLRYVQGGRRRLTLLWCALAGGMAFGTKWSGALAVLTVLVILVLAWVRDRGAPQPELAADADPDAVALGAPAREVQPAGAATPAVAATDDRDGEAPAGASLEAAPARQTLVQALPGALIAAAMLVLIPIGIYMLSYTQYFLAGHPWSQWVELQKQALYFNRHLKTTHTYASKSYTWILDFRPVWYYFKGTHTYRGVVAMGNPFLWWLATGALILGFVLAVLRRSYLLLPTAIIVALLYFPWFAVSRTSFLYYMTPVAPFLAILVAGLLLLLAGRVALPRRGVIVMAVVAVATALLWDPVAALGVRLFGISVGNGGLETAWAIVALCVVLAAVVLLFFLLSGSPRVRAARPYASMVLAGLVIGIVVAFLPVVLNLPISPGHFSHITWFDSWI